MSQYVANIVKYDSSLPFDRICVEHAAMLADENSNSMDDFPELFQISYKWIFDSGASRNFCGQRHAEEFKQHLKKVRPINITTASGTVVMDQALTIEVERLGTSHEVHVLPNTPALFSMGGAIERGFSFFWSNGFLPCLVSAETKKIYVFRVHGGLPMMVKGCLFDKVRDETLINIITGSEKTM